LQLLAVSEERRSSLAKAEAEAHFLSIGMQPHRIAMFCMEAGLDGEEVDLAEWLRFHECIATSEGGDFLISILISQGTAVLAQGKRGRVKNLNSRLSSLFREVEALRGGVLLNEHGRLPRGAAVSFFGSCIPPPPSDFLTKLALMEDLVCEDEDLEEVTEEAWLEIFASLFSNQACDWLLERFDTAQ